MIMSEAAQLLAFIACYDQRTVGDADVIAWAGALHDLDFTACRDMVTRHYSRNPDRIRPADIRYLLGPAPHNKPIPVPPENIAQNPGEWRKRVSHRAIHAPILNQQRRDLVLAHPQIARKLCDPPYSLKTPEQWTGYIPAADTETPGAPRPNDSPIRAQLLAILDQAAAADDQRAGHR
jgi:hypothetical protein